jgi:hypothetical protein
MEKARASNLAHPWAYIVSLQLHLGLPAFGKQ